MSDSGTPRLLRGLLVASAVVFAMWAAAEVLEPLVLSILLAIVLSPLVQWFDRWRLPRIVSVALVFLLLFTMIGGVGYLLGDQFAGLAKHLPEYESNVRSKLEGMKLEHGSALDRAARSFTRLGKLMESDEFEHATPVRLVSHSTAVSWLQHVLGPFEIVMTYVGVVVLLLLFFLVESEDISDRIIQLVGWGRVGVTTKTLNLISHRLSRYLATLALVNAGFGMAVLLGLWTIGLPYPAIWGFLAALLRFVPYVGTLASLGLVETVAIAHFAGWVQPLLVLGLFVSTEMAISVIEPLVYGKSVGISPTGMIVAALFWTWLWGPLGLLLANAMTVCLAVIGQSVPALSFMGTLLRHDAILDADLRWYQRVLNRDQDEALSLLEKALETQGFEEVCDQIVIPALSRAEHDREQDFIDATDIRFLYHVVRDWLGDLANREDLPALAGGVNLSGDESGIPEREKARLPEGVIVGLASTGGEVLVLRMVNLALKPSGLRIKPLSATGSPLRVSDRVIALNPSLVLVSHLPSEGLSRVRYLIRRLRARLTNLPLVVGCWDAASDASQVIENFRSVSVHHVIARVAAVRPFIMERLSLESGREFSQLPSGMGTATGFSHREA